MDRNLTDLSLALLVVRCQRGERSAFEELIAACERRLFVYIRKLVGDEEASWNLLQDVWLRLFRGLPSIRDPRRFRVWIYQVARNTAMDHLRHRYGQPAALVDDPPVDGPDPLERCDDIELVHHGLSRLCLADRDALTLFFLDDLSIEETAEVLGIPPGTVKSRLFKAKRALRAVIEQEGASHDQR
ncbi:RNA polymerase sigma factor [Paludisphaera rhizosphaerae]|uniref:RNA polymerase sigma factor n=1 Tax=Paludisphaera rhizosphaerae TaxID=2711216 RepID=UPI0013EAF6CF|nr:sigma-70 family RNA polymerase sigma factor [Paludisphaera rhizosphaerae]